VEKAVPSYMRSTYTRNLKSLVDLSGQGAAGGFMGGEGSAHQTNHKEETEKAEMESAYNFTDLGIGEGLQSGGQAKILYNSQVSSKPIPLSKRRRSQPASNENSAGKQ
jgi:hypothetical protein